MNTLKLLLSAALLCLSWTAGAQAPAWPDKPVTLVVPFPPGGFTDKLGRMVGEKLAARLGTPVLIDNRPGASASIGTEYVMHARPDGYTLLLASTDGLVKMLQKKGSPAFGSMTPVCMLSLAQITLTVGPRFKGATLADFVQAARAAPEKLTFASNGEGGATHYGMEIFAKQAGIRLTHIPYKGTAPAFNDLMAGEVDATLVTLQGVAPLLEGGRLRALAVTSSKRSPSFPAVPTFAESGYPEFDFQLWYGIAAPAGLPDAVARKLNEQLRAVMDLPDVQRELRVAGAEPVAGSAADMRAFLQKETARWTAIIP